MSRDGRGAASTAAAAAGSLGASGVTVRITTFSIVTGSGACDARCPFCVSRMTGAAPARPTPPRWRNFEIACQLAVRAGATTAMLTGKGEPTLWPELVTEHLERLRRHPIPLVELQTNGLGVARGRLDRGTLEAWYELGLSTVALSVAGVDPEQNRAIYTPQQPYPDLVATIDALHDVGFTVRLICVMLRGFVDGPAPVTELVAFARGHRVEQLTLLPVARPDAAQDQDAAGTFIVHVVDRNEVATAEAPEPSGLFSQVMEVRAFPPDGRLRPGRHDFYLETHGRRLWLGGYDVARFRFGF